MGLSKKILGKHKTFIKENNFVNNNNLGNNCQKSNNFSKGDDPSKIFYSIIDNSESLYETSNVNPSLRKSELNQININPKKANHSKKLTTEEELYDEFNYLLDE